MINKPIFSNSLNYALDYSDKFSNKIVSLLIDKDNDRVGLLVSAIFHSFIIITAIGIPSCFAPKNIYVPNIIPIEILNIDDVTRIPDNPTETEDKSEVNKKDIKEERFTSADRTEITKLEEKKEELIKEELIEDMPKNQELEKVIDETKEVDAPLVKDTTSDENIEYETLPIKKIKPKIKPKPKVQENIKTDVDLKIKPKIKPKPKVQENIKTDVDVKIEPKLKELTFNEEVASVLKDLRKDKVTINKKEEVQENEKKETKGKLSISEQYLLKQQLYACWRIPPNTNYPVNMEVKVRVFVDPDKTVNAIRILDTKKMEYDPIFRTLAESARSAVLNPACSPLRLPDDKYKIWKKFIFVFNPNWMLGN